MSRVLLVIWLAIAALLALLAAAVVVALTRADGHSWPAALLRGGGAFAGTFTVAMAVIALFMPR
ncbi:hypothetical protein [Streptomyces sp. NPDC096351]|uniref:hypothetical protein n=1 Tax=Streptomyces sp. NPDC096351 TaxID=3366087 RepID=UPI003801DA45